MSAASTSDTRHRLAISLPIVIGILFVASVASLLCCCRRRRKNRRLDEEIAGWREKPLYVLLLVLSDVPTTLLAAHVAFCPTACAHPKRQQYPSTEPIRPCPSIRLSTTLSSTPFLPPRHVLFTPLATPSHRSTTAFTPSPPTPRSTSPALATSVPTLTNLVAPQTRFGERIAAFSSSQRPTYLGQTPMRMPRARSRTSRAFWSSRAVTLRCRGQTSRECEMQHQMKVTHPQRRTRARGRFSSLVSPGLNKALVLSIPLSSQSAISANVNVQPPSQTRPPLHIGYLLS
jgi:hypothetical protein